MKHQSQDLIRLFETCFACDYNTILVGGGDEPEYLPAGGTSAQHRIIFTRDYFRSALHEIAHWCVAGEQRRMLPDFGYWYAPDGRNAEQQRKFELVEVKPQALEWLFCAAARHPFSVSLDNLNGEPTDSGPFQRSVHAQLLSYLDQGVPERPGRFINVLIDTYRPGLPLSRAEFDIDFAEL